MSDMTDDPFCPMADPYFKPEVEPQDDAESREMPCHCGGAEQSAEPVNLGRRRTMIAAGILMVAPLNAAANAMVPCVQTRQRIRPCAHKFCKHYRGRGDYHGR